MKTMNLKPTALAVSCTTAGLLALGMAGTALAAPGTLATSPLFLQNAAVQPNILFMVDDSGSMDWEVLMSNDARIAHGSSADSGYQDFTPNSTTARRNLCYAYNVLAYNPNRTYTPWSGLDSYGNAYTDMTLSAARDNPYTSTTSNLSNHFYFTWNDDGDGVYESGECPAPSSVTTSTDCASYSGCVRVSTLSAAQQVNYANWYSYYRKREYVAKRALSQIIDSSDSRLGLATLHNNNNVLTLVQDVDDITTPINTTAQANKKALLKNLSRINSSGGTPLRQSLENAGEYYAGNSSWGSTPILSAALGGECQQNFTILMSDGYWNGNSPNVGNTDIDGPGIFDGGAYADAYSDTLADVAMKYYETDLSTLADKVPVLAGIDDNNAQHMVTYTVGFGVTGTLSATAQPGQAGFSWPQPTADAQTTIDDMRHAAYNGRGQFLSAKDPQALIDSLTQYIADIQARTGTAAAVSFNSTNLNTGTRIYQATFDSSGWSGDLLAKNIFVDPLSGVASISGIAWQASTDIDGRTPASRQIITYDSGTGSGVGFNWSALNAAQQTDLRTNGSGGTDIEAAGMARLDYIRGVRGCEKSGSSACSYTDSNSQTFNSRSFRDRTSALGDIVHSSPAYVGPPSLAYPDSIEPTAPYSAFAISNSSRPGMTYVGANDGMLHAFDDNGVEVFGYIPGALFSTAPGAGLHYLTDQNFTHRYYVDQSPTVQDAYVTVGGTTGWHTVLVGALRGGGKSVYAIDVTNPSALTTSAASKVMWEFTDKDMGYTFSDIQIGKMNNGKWAAVFGNGYNNDPSGDGHAKLYVLYLDGSNAASPVIIDTGVGILDPMTKSCASTSSDCNGLSTPRLADLNGDGTIDRIYAGDVQGNMWAFDVTDPSNTANWLSAYGANPLFRACSAYPCTSSNRQPITGQPDIVQHPSKTAYATRPNLLVYFGTGQYLTQADIGNAQLQTFYGVWDSATGNLDRSSLQPQTISTTYNDPVLGSVRTVSSNIVNYSTSEKGWLIDLPVTGERSVTNPVAFGSVVFFNTLIPNTSSSNMCDVGGSGWLMAVDLLTGGEPAFIPIDVNNDGVFDASDKLQGISVVGTESTGVPAESRFISEKRVTADSTGAINIDNIQSGPPQVPSRMSWSELDAP
jgi:type IV pilus assembly protein PilY1